MQDSFASAPAADQRGSSAVADIRSAYLDALLAGDAVRARHVVRRAADEGLSMASLYLDVLEPALEDVGLLWSAGDVNVAQEHYATALTTGLMAELAVRWRQDPTSGRLAVVTCSPGERHQLGARMISDFLEAAGWEVIALGADTPARDLALLVELERPDVLAVSTSMREHLDGVAATLAEVGRVQPRPFVIVGGRAWRDIGDERAGALGADARVTDPRRLVALVAERFPALADDPDE